MALLTPDQHRTMEALSHNLARAAVTAQSAIAEAALRQAERPPALSPDPFHVGPALTEVMSKLAADPDGMMRAQADLYARYMDLWQATARRIAGEKSEPVIKPPAGDKRFNDPEWENQPVFDVMKQSYLLTTDWLNSLVGQVKNVDPMTKRRVEFFMKMLTDAFSPSNFLISNPVALREAIATKGESIVKGMENFAADLERGHGALAISQTDFQPFKVGENIATAPGKVIYQNDILQLLQFSPTTEQVYEIPLLIFPPWINKWYILDLRVENSMIRWLTGQGFTVFVASWVNPDGELAKKTFEDYMFEGVYAATEQVMKQCGVTQVNTVGYCIGGTLLSCALAHMAAKGDKRISSATFFAAQQDFVEAGDLLLFTDEAWVSDIERRMDQEGGVLPSQNMADTFNSLRANDLIWSFFVNNYLLGKEPRPFDLLFWNSDQTRMPKTLHLFYLREFYGKNRLAKGDLVFGGETLDLHNVKTPVFIQSSKDDHISPYRSVYRGAKLFGGPTTFIMAGSGHIAGVINHPDARKYQYWINETLPADVEDWRDGSVEHPGSWWPYWAEWLKAKSGKKVTARDPSKGPLKPLEDSPGSFVLVRD
ncbi:MAG TPA: class I poly(R)-hydroxyalkanoic acid synthase [Caulobacteraceae bacterium]|nr:class I poly(R)-hydroxyalkanoic acid synthase [Caulobacteraceae bacterium]